MTVIMYFKLNLSHVLVAFATLLISSLGYGQDESRWLVSRNGKFGFIDSNGIEIIPTIYNEASPFSEGLAAVMKNGQFGYINALGKEVIPFEYDLAHSFKNGLARVVLHGKNYLIDKSNTVVFDHTFSQYHLLDEDYFIVRGKDFESYGLINRKSELLIDTVWREIKLSDDGQHWFLVRSSKDYNLKQFAIADKTGNFITNPKDFEKVNFLSNGDVLLRLPGQNAFVINSAGREKYRAYMNNWTFPHNFDFHDDIGVVIWGGGAGAVDEAGNLLFYNENWKKILPFYNNRSFVMDHKNKWWLIDKKGNTLSKTSFDEYPINSYRKNLRPFFNHGYELVRIKGKWQRIDRNGEIIPSQAKLPDFTSLEFHNSPYAALHHSVNYKLLGYWDVVNDRFLSINEYKEVINSTTEETNIRRVNQDSVSGYMKGDDWIWSSPTARTPHRLNIAHKIHTEFPIQAGYKINTEGYFEEYRETRQLQEFNFVSQPGLGIHIDTTQLTHNSDSTICFPFYVYNNSSDTLNLNYLDYLHIELEAMTSNGSWHSIHAHHFYGCATLSTFEFLPYEVLSYQLPLMEGTYKTRLRLRFSTNVNNAQYETVSNSFVGTINPGQFGVYK